MWFAMRMNCADHVEHCVVLSVCVSSGKRFVVVAGRRTMSDFIRFPNVLRSIRTILLYFVIGRRKRKQCNKMYRSQLACLRRLRCPRCNPPPLPSMADSGHNGGVLLWKNTDTTWSFDASLHGRFSTTKDVAAVEQQNDF